MCDITVLQAIIIAFIIFILFGIFIYKKSDGMGIE